MAVDALILDQAADTTSRIIPLDWRQCSMGVSFQLTSSGATTGATIEVTLDDIQDPNVTPVWSPATDPITATSAVLKLHDSPWRACRLVTDNNGTDTTTLHILQN